MFIIEALVDVDTYSDIAYNLIPVLSLNHVKH